MVHICYAFDRSRMTDVVCCIGLYGLAVAQLITGRRGAMLTLQRVCAIKFQERGSRWPDQAGSHAGATGSEPVTVSDAI